MLFQQVCKVAILKNLSWFLICLGGSYIVKDLTLQAIVDQGMSKSIKEKC